MNAVSPLQPPVHNRFTYNYNPPELSSVNGIFLVKYSKSYTKLSYIQKFNLEVGPLPQLSYYAARSRFEF